jgi:hypothetical protein
VRDKDQRRPGYDFCFSVPKSVSVYHAISGDQAVQRTIEEAVLVDHGIRRSEDGNPGPREACGGAGSRSDYWQSRVRSLYSYGDAAH